LINGATVKATQTITDTNWHHYAMFFDRSNNNSYAYLDGVQGQTYFAPNFQQAMDTTREVYINGQGYAPTVSNINGSIDEVKIWNRTLSASEVQGLYEQKVKGRDSFGYRAKDNVWYGSQTIQQTETICLNGGACTQNISTNSTHTILCGLTTCTGIA